MASALASLTANYTDSEGEDDLDPSMELSRIAIVKEGRRSPNGEVDTPGSSGSSCGALRQTGSAGGTPTKKAKLVSYIDPDAGLSDEESLLQTADRPLKDDHCRREGRYRWIWSLKRRTKRTVTTQRMVWRTREGVLQLSCKVNIGQKSS